MIRVLIADDHELMRSGLRGMLDAQDDIEVAGEAADGGAAVDEAIRLRPDVVMMDIRMPRVDGIEATRRLVAHGGAPQILILTTFDLRRGRLGGAARRCRRIHAQGRRAAPARRGGADRRLR